MIELEVALKPESEPQQAALDLPALIDPPQQIIAADAPNYILDGQRVMDALHTVGPSPGLIAQQTGLSIKRVKECLEQNEQARKAYSSVILRVAKQLREHRCNFGEVADKLGVSRSAVLKWVEENRHLRDVKEDFQESMTDTAVIKLYDSIELGKQWAIEKQLNSASGKKRGYGESQAPNLVDEMSKLGLVAADIRIQIRQKFIKPLIQDGGASENSLTPPEPESSVP